MHRIATCVLTSVFILTNSNGELSSKDKSFGEWNCSISTEKFEEAKNTTGCEPPANLSCERWREYTNEDYYECKNGSQVKKFTCKSVRTSYIFSSSKTSCNCSFWGKSDPENCF